METCATCLWWDEDELPDSNWGLCKLIACEHISKAYPEGRHEEDAGNLFTLPDFGCNQWSSGEVLS